MDKKFKEGDKVRIHNLISITGSKLNGKIGHEGTIIYISTSGFYELKPNCIGGSWPAECLELINSPLYKIY